MEEDIIHEQINKQKIGQQKQKPSIKQFKYKTVESVFKSKESDVSLYKSHISTQKQQNKTDLEFLKNQNFKNDPEKDKKPKSKKIESLEQNLESLYDSSNLDIPAFESKQFVQVEVNQTLKNIELNNKENNQIADSQMVSHSILKNSNKFNNNIIFNQNKDKDNNQQFTALNSKNNSTKIKHSREQDLSMSRQESENLLQSFQIKKNDSFFEDCTQLDQKNDPKKEQQSYKELKRKKTVHYGDEEDLKASDKQFNDFVSNLSNLNEQQDDLQPSPNRKNLSRIFKNSVRMSVNLKQLTEKYNRGNTLDKSHQNFLEKVNQKTNNATIGKKKKISKYDLLKSLKLLSRIRISTTIWMQMIPSFFLKNLNYQQKKIIQDLSDGNLDKVDQTDQYNLTIKMAQKGCFSKHKVEIVRRLCNFFNKLPLLESSSPIIIIAEMLNCVSTILIMFFFTIQIVYGLYLIDSLWFQIIILVTNIICFFYIIIKFNTSIYKEGILIDNKLEIQISYLNTSFNSDMAGLVIGVGYLVSHSYGFNNDMLTYIISLLYFYKLISLKASFTTLEQIVYLFGDVSHYYSLFKMMANSILLCHVIGLLWYSLYQLEIKYFGQHDNWVSAQQLNEYDWFKQYLYAFYWAASTIMLVGPIGYNYIEVAFTTIILFTTVGFFAYILNTISQIIFDLNKSRAEYLQEFKAINRYMKEKQTSKEIQSKVRNYLEYYFRSHESQTQNNEVLKILEKLPKILRDDMLYEINSRRIDQFKKITQHFSQKTIDKITSQFEETSRLPSEIIFKQDDNNEDEKYLYWIKSGQVELYVNLPSNSKRTLKLCGKGEFIGQYAFFTNLPYNYNAKCLQTCIIYKIKKKTLYDIANEQDEDKQKLVMIKDEILFKGFTSHLSQLDYCIVCTRRHAFDICPQISYQPNLRRLVAINNSNIIQERNMGEKQKYERGRMYKTDVSNALILFRFRDDIYAQCMLNQELRIQMNQLTEKIQQYNEELDAYYDFDEYYSQQESSQSNLTESQTSSSNSDSFTSDSVQLSVPNKKASIENDEIENKIAQFSSINQKLNDIKPLQQESVQNVVNEQFNFNSENKEKHNFAKKNTINEGFFENNVNNQIDNRNSINYLNERSEKGTKNEINMSLSALPEQEIPKILKEAHQTTYNNIRREKQKQQTQQSVKSNISSQIKQNKKIKRGPEHSSTLQQDQLYPSDRKIKGKETHISKASHNPSTGTVISNQNVQVQNNNNKNSSYTILPNKNVPAQRVPSKKISNKQVEFQNTNAAKVEQFANYIQNSQQYQHRKSLMHQNRESFSHGVQLGKSILYQQENAQKMQKSVNFQHRKSVNQKQLLSQLESLNRSLYISQKKQNKAEQIIDEYYNRIFQYYQHVFEFEAMKNWSIYLPIHNQRNQFIYALQRQKKQKLKNLQTLGSNRDFQNENTQNSMVNSKVAQQFI